MTDRTDHTDRNVLTDLDGQDPAVRQLFDACLEATDPLWDQSAGLVEHPTNDYHPVRASSRYAVGLLARDDDGDHDRAAATLDSVLDYQFTEDPEAVYFGTWARTPAEHHPMDDPTEWDDYDPNWREFVGTTLALVHDEFAGRIPEDLRDRIAEAVRTAAAGTLDRDVTPAYTNIALMRALLLQWTGDLDGDETLTQIGRAYTDEIHELFSPHETFCEFNSPTYAGVDLDALGHLVTSPRSGPLEALGAEMEAALWRQLGDFYHADLQTLCGPYSRAYGMDTRRTLTDYYVWLAAGGTDREPYPASHHTEIPGNYCSVLLSVVLAGWSRAPDDAVENFDSFRGDRHVTRTVDCGDSEVDATAWLGPDAMAGGFDGRLGNAGSQLHPATVHWRAGAEADTDTGAGTDAVVGWVRALETRSDRVTARAEPGLLRVEAADGGVVTFEVFAPGVDAGSVDDAEWRLPGLTVDVDAADADVTVEAVDDSVEVQYSFPPDETAHITLQFDEVG